MPASFFFARLLCLGLLLGGPLAWAQAAPPALADSTAQVAREDTAIAVQRLFFEQRHHGRRQLLVNGLGTVSAGLLLVTSNPHTTYQRLSTGAFGLVFGYYAYQLMREVTLQRRYRPAREQHLLAALAQGQPLPRRVRQQLGSNYFSIKTTTY